MNEGGGQTGVREDGKGHLEVAAVEGAAGGQGVLDGFYVLFILVSEGVNEIGEYNGWPRLFGRFTTYLESRRGSTSAHMGAVSFHPCRKCLYILYNLLALLIFVVRLRQLLLVVQPLLQQQWLAEVSMLLLHLFFAVLLLVPVVQFPVQFLSVVVLWLLFAAVLLLVGVVRFLAAVVL